MIKLSKNMTEKELAVLYYLVRKSDGRCFTENGVRPTRDACFNCPLNGQMDRSSLVKEAETFLSNFPQEDLLEIIFLSEEGIEP